VAWERKHECELVIALINARRGTVSGFDESLAQLQAGRLRVLILARKLDAKLHQCVECGWADRSADPVCPACGGNRRNVGLWDALPALARKHDTEIQIVNGAASELLKNTEGAAGWLRPPKATKAAAGK
jgi:peptide subunit release factor 1 (eRF1)